MARQSPSGAPHRTGIQPQLLAIGAARELARRVQRVASGAGAGTDGKVIYPTREAAEAAARELESLGARRLRPYLCARSRHGHFHLATDTTRTLHERIPQQRRPA